MHLILPGMQVFMKVFLVWMNQYLGRDNILVFSGLKYVFSAWKIASSQPATICFINFELTIKTFQHDYSSSEKKLVANSLLSLPQYQPVKEVCIISMAIPKFESRESFQHMPTIIFFSFNGLAGHQWNIYLTSVALPVPLNRWACCSAGRQSGKVIFLW